MRERPLTDSSDRLAVYFGRDCDVPFASCVPGYRHAFAVNFICEAIDRGFSRLDFYKCVHMIVGIRRIGHFRG